MKTSADINERTAAIGRTIKRYPVQLGAIFLCVVFLGGLEARRHFSAVPARQWNSSNLTRIRVADPDNFAFAVFGDNRNSQYVFENLLRLIDHDRDISFAVSLGDMVQRGEKGRYRWFLQQVGNNLSIPLLTAMGDHERRGAGPGLFREIFGSPHYSFKIGKNYFIVLDNGDGKELDPEQKRWLVKALEKSAQCDTCSVFLNAPLFHPPGGTHHPSRTKDCSEKLIRLFLKYGVTHIFASHIHGFFKGRWEGIAFSITGGAGAALRGTDPENHFFHFLKVNVRNGNIRVEVKHVPFAASEWIRRFNYAVWLRVSSFLRFHGIPFLLMLFCGVLAMDIYRRASNSKETLRN